MIADPYPVLWTGQRAVVVLPEHIDLSNSADIRGELLSVINRGATALIADMSATVSCDNSGADAVARAYRRAFSNGTDLRLVVVSPIVRRVIGISGVDRLVSLYPSLEAALAARTPAARALAPAAIGSAAAGSGAAGSGAAGSGAAGSAAAGPATTESATTGSDSRPADRPESVPPGTGEVPAGQAEPDIGLGTEIALLDHQGVIVSVNDAWQAFAATNKGDPARVGPGVSYLEVCAAAGDDPVALEVAANIHRALAGDLPGPLVVEVPCHSPDTARWFEMLISPRMDDDGGHRGATVTLSLAKSEPRLASAAPVAGAGDSAQVIVRLTEDRERIAAGMNDLLVHRLFSAGLSLQTALGILGAHPATGKIWDAVNDLDLAVRELRSILFDQLAPDDQSD
ncbi:MAG: STAS domain-containing protein [Streptosporangiaceae bacterium]